MAESVVGGVGSGCSSTGTLLPSATESLGSSATIAGEGAGLGRLGSGVTRGPRVRAEISGVREDCRVLTPLSLEDAGTATQVVTTRKTMMAASIAARRLRKRHGMERSFRGGRAAVFAGNSLLGASSSPTDACEGSLGSE